MSEEAKTRLTLDEIDFIKSLFDKADTNKDKVLSYHEFQAGISGTLVFSFFFSFCKDD
jgi:Ca2+-binding EF-hand superfamily protein